MSNDDQPVPMADVEIFGTTSIALERRQMHSLLTALLFQTSAAHTQTAKTAARTAWDIAGEILRIEDQEYDGR